MKHYLFVLLLCLSLPVFARQWDEEVMTDACVCIYQSPVDVNVDSLINECLLKSLLHSLREEGISEEKIMSDYAKQESFVLDSTRISFGTYVEMLSANCWAAQTLVEKKQKLYYFDSKSDSANYFYRRALPEQAIACDSSFVPAWDQLAQQYYSLGEQEKAIEAYRRSLQLFPEGSVALDNLEEIYFRNENYEKALKLNVKRIKFYPRLPNGYLGLSRICLANRDYETALRLALHALEKCPDTDSTGMGKGRELIRSCYYYMGIEGDEDRFADLAPEYIPVYYEQEDFNQLKDIPLQTAMDCRLMNCQALTCARYILSTPIDRKNRARMDAIAFMMRWIEHTPDYYFFLGKDVAPVLDKQGNVLSVFLAAYVECNLTAAKGMENSKEVTQCTWDRFKEYAGQKANGIRIKLNN